jgi:hypothetical protein
VFLIIGVLWGRKYKLIKICHLGGLAFAILLQTFNWYCPLTYLETWLKAQYDPSLSYEGSFIVFYLNKLIYLDLPSWIIFILTVLLTVINLLFYRKKKLIKIFSP